MSMSLNKIAVLISIGLLTGLFAVGSAFAASRSVLFIMDGSGSMKGKLGDQTKMQAAKEVFKSLLTDLPENINVGLMAYGHHGNKDCSVIEMMNPVAPLNIPAIQANIDSLSPDHGATPIAGSLEKGAEALKAAGGEKAIILISDGRETCGGDPVAVAKRLRAQGIDITTHVVGLGVNAEETAQLTAIAGAGGGKYYAANNADELKSSLAEIKKKVVAKRGKVIFEDNFDEESLPDKWSVINPDEDNMIIEDGHLTIVQQSGLHNVLLYNGTLPSSYEIKASFTTSVIDFPYNHYATQRAGLILYQDEKNQMLLITSVPRDSYAKRVTANYARLKKGKWMPDYLPDIGGSKSPATYEFRIQKRKHKYTAFFRNAKGKWVSIGSYTDLKGKYRPGVVAFRDPNAREVSTDFDWFRITAAE